MRSALKLGGLEACLSRKFFENKYYEKADFGDNIVTQKFRLDFYIEIVNLLILWMFFQ